MAKMTYLQDFYLAVKNPRPGAGIVESILGTCMFRENEDTRSYNMYKNVLHDYLANDINKCFHLTIEEYLQLTPYEKLMMDEVAEEYNKQVREAMEKAQKEGEQSAANKWSKATRGQGMSGLDDLSGLM